MGKRKKKEDKPCRLLSESAKENLAELIIRSAGRQTSEEEQRDKKGGYCRHREAS